MKTPLLFHLNINQAVYLFVYFEYIFLKRYSFGKKKQYQKITNLLINQNLILQSN